MACPSQGILNTDITVTLKTLNVNDEPEWADALPTYTIYKDDIDPSNIVSGFENVDMVQNEDITGSYYAQIYLDSDVFNIYSDYKIVINATVDSNPFNRVYKFTAVRSTDVVLNDMESAMAVSYFKGTFRPDSFATLFIKITNFDGIPIDPIAINCTVKGPREDMSDCRVVIDKEVPFLVDRGFYVFEWEIDRDEIPGSYVVDWEYYIDGEERHEYQNIVVAQQANEPKFYSTRFIGFRNALEHHIVCAQSIPIYYEQARPSYDLKTFQFSFQNWNQSSGVRVYRNKELIRDGLEVDYFNGKVRFKDSILPQEIVNVDYNFRWFTDEELNRFLVNALQTVNLFPPVSNYSLETVPDRFIPPILYGAAKDAIRQMLMCLQFQQPQQIFGGADKAQQAFQGLETLKQNYEKDWEKLVEQKKFGPYPRSSVISVPEYTLPGGRCISLYTKGLCKIEDTIIEETMANIFKLHMYYKSIEILSHSDKNGDMVFSPINYIWMSGEKDVYELKTKKGFDVRTSDEHLFFVNGRYVPLMDIKDGDNILICDNNNIEDDVVKSIRKLRRKELMCDLEVNNTENLFANGIKCHNSRWFRYLFKG